MATAKELLTNLANNLRDLTNTTDEMGLSKMAEHVGNASAETDEQDALVEQLMTAMQGKSVQGGNGSVETCTLTITSDFPESAIGLYAFQTYEDGELIARYGNTVANYLGGFPFSTTVVCGSPFCFEFTNITGTSVILTSGVENVGTGRAASGKITAAAGETATLHIAVYD